MDITGSSGNQAATRLWLTWNALSHKSKLKGDRGWLLRMEIGTCRPQWKQILKMIILCFQWNICLSLSVQCKRKWAFCSFFPNICSNLPWTSLHFKMSRDVQRNKWQETCLVDPYVKVYLICDGRRLKKRKTTIKKSTLNPAYNEAIIFDIPPENVEQVSLSIMVMDYDRWVKQNSKILFLRNFGFLWLHMFISELLEVLFLYVDPN